MLPSQTLIHCLVLRLVNLQLDLNNPLTRKVTHYNLLGTQELTHNHQVLLGSAMEALLELLLEQVDTNEMLLEIEVRGTVLERGYNSSKLLKDFIISRIKQVHLHVFI